MHLGGNTEATWKQLAGFLDSSPTQQLQEARPKFIKLLKWKFESLSLIVSEVANRSRCLPVRADGQTPPKSKASD